MFTQPWLTLAKPCTPTDQYASCRKSPDAVKSTDHGTSREYPGPFISCGLFLKVVRYVPLGVSSPGRPELIGQLWISAPSRYSLSRCVAVLATTISDRPIVNCWLSV